MVRSLNHRAACGVPVVQRRTIHFNWHLLLQGFHKTSRLLYISCYPFREDALSLGDLDSHTTAKLMPQLCATTILTFLTCSHSGHT